MNDVQIRALLAGVFFGIWPLFMQKSGLSGNIASAMFVFGSLVFIAPLAYREWQMSSMLMPAWGMILLACATGAMGMLAFNGMLSRATVQTVGSLFVLMIVVQIMVPALYQMYQTGLDAKKVIGFALAMGAAYLLK